jgi:hypothetical protein
VNNRNCRRPYLERSWTGCPIGRRRHLIDAAGFGVPTVPVSIYLLKRGTLPSL